VGDDKSAGMVSKKLIKLIIYLKEIWLGGLKIDLPSAPL
jgi:hypothetical protein